MTLRILPGPAPVLQGSRDNVAPPVPTPPARTAIPCSCRQQLCLIPKMRGIALHIICFCLVLVASAFAARITIRQGDSISAALLRANDNDEIFVSKGVVHGLIFVGPGYRASNVAIVGEDLYSTFVEGVVWRNDARVKGLSFQNLYFNGSTEDFMFDWDFNSTTPLQLDSPSGVDDLTVDNCIFRAEPSRQVYEPIWPTGIFRGTAGYGGTLKFTNSLCAGMPFLYLGERPRTAFGQDSDFAFIVDSNTLWHYSCKIRSTSNANSQERLQFTNNVIIRPEGPLYMWVDSFTEWYMYGAKHIQINNNDWGGDVYTSEFKISFRIQAWETLEIKNNNMGSILLVNVGDGDPLCPNTVITGNNFAPANLVLEEKWYPHVKFVCAEKRTIDVTHNFWGYTNGPLSQYIVSGATGTRPNENPQLVGTFPWYIDWQMTKLALPCVDAAGAYSCDTTTQKCDFSVGKCICSTCKYEYTASNLSPALQTNPTGTPPTAGSLPSGPAPASSGTGGGNGDNGNIGDPTRTPAGSSGDDTGAKVGAAIGGIVTPFVILVISLVVYKNFIMTPAKPQKYHQSTSTYVPPQYK